MLTNLLPYDGTVYYNQHGFSSREAEQILNTLIQKVPWQNDVVMMFGKTIITKRQMAWYANTGLTYTYSNIKREPLPWPQFLKSIKTKVSNVTGQTYNSCLLNLYHNGKEAMGWHSDDEPELEHGGAIASVSFGAQRKFVFKHKTTKQKIEIQLAAGSILLMQGLTQTCWQHALPATTKVFEPRINLTFRTIAV